MNIYVGNLAYKTTDDGLKAAFAAYGEVTSARVVTDNMTGRSKGFGFVEMPDSAQAGAAIRALDGQRLDDRKIHVEESMPRQKADDPWYTWSDPPELVIGSTPDTKKHDDLQAGKLEAARSRAIAASQQNNFKPETVETVRAVDQGTLAPVSTSEVGADELTESEFLKKFIADVKECGYIYNPQDIIRFHTSVKCGSFTLLGGAPGWGKSTLVSLYARALLGNSQPNQEKMRYLTIDVNPAWMEPSDVLGYWNLEGKFSCAFSGLVPFLRDSGESEEVRLVCLEEMNLARVEHYFSDFVQLMSRNLDERFLSGIPRNDGDGRNGARLAIPENVRFVGTNNLDETTQCFSARFYDRCNYIELQQTNSLLEFPKFKPSPCRGRFDYGVTFSQYNKWRDDDICAGRLHKMVEGAFREIADWLKKLNLLPSPRVRQAILEYVLNRPFVDGYGCGLGKFHEGEHQLIALDEAIAQRVLARYSPNYWRDEGDVRDVPETFNEELFPLSYGLFKGKINQKEIPVRS